MSNFTFGPTMANVDVMQIQNKQAKSKGRGNTMASLISEIYLLTSDLAKTRKVVSDSDDEALVPESVYPADPSQFTSAQASSDREKLMPKRVVTKKLK